MGIMTGFLLLLCVGVTVSSAVDLQKRIIGGQDCEINERLYHVKLTNFEGNLTCGGTLVSDKWVLTAAHCWQLQMKALVGAHPGLIRKSLIIEAPPQIYVENNKVHDLMLLQLPETFTRIDPIRLPDCNKKINIKGKGILRIGDEVQVAGFGYTKTGMTGLEAFKESRTLQCVNMTLVSCGEFKKTMNQDQTHSTSWQHWNCYEADGVSLYQGDSGGGVVYREGGTDYLYGVNVVAFSPIYTKSAVFMDVCKYMDWIKKTIKK